VPYSLPDVPEVTVAELVANDEEGSLLLLDVREMEEWLAGHIPGSVHIPLGEVALRIGELDPDRPVVAICHSGVRSLYAVDILLKSGFRNARSLTGGIIAWAEEGQPLAH
jgi:rhodanese-related sulfurtransferase